MQRFFAVIGLPDDRHLFAAFRIHAHDGSRQIAGNHHTIRDFGGGQFVSIRVQPNLLHAYFPAARIGLDVGHGDPAGGDAVFIVGGINGCITRFGAFNHLVLIAQGQVFPGINPVLVGFVPGVLILIAGSLRPHQMRQRDLVVVCDAGGGRNKVFAGIDGPAIQGEVRQGVDGGCFVHPLLFHFDAGSIEGVDHGERAALVAGAAHVGVSPVSGHVPVRADDRDGEHGGVHRAVYIFKDGILVIRAQVCPFILPYLLAVDDERQFFQVALLDVGVLPRGGSISLWPAHQRHLHKGISLHVFRRILRPDLDELDAGFLVIIRNRYPAFADALHVVGRFHDFKADRLVGGHAAVRQAFTDAVDVFLGQVVPPQEPGGFRSQPFRV